MKYDQPDFEIQWKSSNNWSSNGIDNELFYAKMGRNSMVYVSNCSFKIWDIVIVKNDLYNNTKTRIIKKNVKFHNSIEITGRCLSPKIEVKKHLSDRIMKSWINFFLI